MPKFRVDRDWRPFGASLPMIPEGTLIGMSVSGPPFFWAGQEAPPGVNINAIGDWLPIDTVKALDQEALNWLIAWHSSRMSVFDLERRLRFDPATCVLNLDGVPKQPDAEFALMTDMPCSMGLIPSGFAVRVAAGQMEGYAKTKYLGSVQIALPLSPSWKAMNEQAMLLMCRWHADHLHLLFSAVPIRKQVNV